MIRQASARLVTGSVVSRRQCSGIAPAGGAISRASTRVSAMLGGSSAAQRTRWRFGRLTHTVPAHTATCA